MVRIYDENGSERDNDWLLQTFGPVTIHTPDDAIHAYEIVELNARKGSSAVIATVQDADGTPLPDIPTVWHWPDAPHLPGAGWLGRGVVGITNQEGLIGHAMGAGADYAPPTKGPHALWIQGTDRSQMIDGLGMLTAPEDVLSLVKYQNLTNQRIASGHSFERKPHSA